MAINDGFYWYKNVLKKQLKLASRIYLSIAIVLFPFFLMNTANASSVGGWSMGNPIAQGASTIYEGSKNVIINGADYVKNGTAKITPTAANVAKTLGKGVAGVAVSVAVDQLFGAVDWVLDPANNQIKYKEEGRIGGTYVIGCTFIDCTKDNYEFSLIYVNADTPNQLCKMVGDSLGIENAKRFDGVQCAGGVYGNNSAGYYSIVTLPAAEGEQKTVPLDSVASQIISNAESETDAEKKAAAQVVTTAAAADIVAEAETDNVKARPIAQQLEASSTTKPADEAAAAQANTATGTQTQNPTKPATSDLALEFPAFCGWSPVVCEAAQVVISFPQTLTDWWEAAKDWATSEPQQKDPENLEIEDLELDAAEVTLSASTTCPQDSVSFSVMGNSVSLDMPYQPVCDALNFFKPAVLLVGAVASVYIVAGVRTKEEDQP